MTQQAPAAQLGHEPDAVGVERHVHRAVGEEAQRMGVLPGVAEAVAVMPEKARRDGRQRYVDVVAGGDQLRGAAAVLVVALDETAGGEHRHDQRTGGIGVLLDERTGAAEDLFRVIRPDRLAGCEGETGLFRHGLCAPGFTRTETVDAAVTQVAHHLCRRNHQGAHVAQRMDAVGGEPVIQPQRVGAGGKGLGEGQACTALAHAAVQRFGIGHAGFLERHRQADALAVLRQPHEHGHVHRRAAADAQMHGVDQPIEPVGGIQLAVEQFVAQAGPGMLAAQVERQPERLGESLSGGDDQRGGIGQCHEAEVDAAFLRSIASGNPGEDVMAW